MRFIILLALILSCTIMDTYEAPSVQNLNRIVIKIDDKIEVGIIGTIKPNSKLYVRTYGKGSLILRGFENCGYIIPVSIKGFGWEEIDLSVLPASELACTFTLQLKTNDYDTPMIGKLVIQDFPNLNILPLDITANKVKRSGVNYVQLSTSVRSTKILKSGISEENTIYLHLGNNIGELTIENSCDIPSQTLFYDNWGDYPIKINDLYQGEINKDCTFYFSAVHKYAIAQTGTLLVTTYKNFGSWLTAPIFKNGCFEFTDKYVIKTIVNNKEDKCDKKAKSWQVEGITSKGRMFYGEFENNNWKVMK